MLTGHYEFTCRLTTDAQLPAYKGSMFRGVFGHALKKVVCTVRQRQCVGCMLASRCLYARVFERRQWQNEDRHRLANPPQPYMIVPDLDRRTRYRCGETLRFRLTLFGEFNDFLPYFVYAVETMGTLGIGRKIDSRGAGFEIKSIHHQGRSVYDSEKSQLDMNFQVPELTLHEIISTPVTQLRLCLLTPLRLKFNSSLQAELPFEVLIRAVLRRISSLCNSYGSGEPDLDYRGIIARAGEVRILSDNLHWFDWKRYSNRQEQQMFMGGMSGEVCYQGDLNIFIPLLQAVQPLHLGKQTTFGLGGFNLEIGNGTHQESGAA